MWSVQMHYGILMGTINSLGGALSFMEESMVTVDLFLTYMLLTIIAQKQHLIKHFKRELKRMVCHQEFALTREEKMLGLQNS